MTGSSNRQRVIVVGGGISGLSAAHKLWEVSAESGVPLDITLIESRNRLGGVIHTVRRDGFLIDSGPDNFVTFKPWAMALARRLGIESQIIGTTEMHRSALVVRDGRLLPIPEGFLLMAPTKVVPVLTSRVFSLSGKLRMGMEVFIPRRSPNGDESLASFVTRRFGREALDRVVQPLISGIYTARPERLSLRATMPRFLDLEAKHGSIIRGMRKEGKARKTSGSGARYGMFVTFKDGLQTLIDALKQRLKEADFQLNQRVIQVGTADDDTTANWVVDLEDGTRLKTDGVIVTGPSKHAAQVLGQLDPALAHSLSQVGYASSAVVHLAYRRDQIGHPLNAFGCVVPIVENRNIIAASFSSIKYEGRAPKDTVLLRAFMGGALHPHMAGREDGELIQLARRDMDDLLNISGSPLFGLVSRWPDSMAQYDVGHLERVQGIKERMNDHRGLALAGNGFDGVGIPDCIRAGEAAAESVAEDLGIATAPGSRHKA